MRRSRIGSSYVQRRSDGTFKNWTNVGSSLRADRRTKAKPVKAGYGHLGDVKKGKMMMSNSKMKCYAGKECFENKLKYRLAKGK